ncbi:MAG TPA: YfhO family protein [Candidatus Brocadiia bacterium]|nr:YfhO family protein [Candidatus Brocadiales bacterium]
MIKELKAILLLAILTVIFSWKIIFTGEYTLMAFYDLSVQDFAFRELASNFIKQGILPLWDPYTCSGRTFIGEGQSGLFYPLNLIQSFFLIGEARTDTFIIEIFIITGFFLAATFQYFFSRTLGLSSFSSIVSAMSFAFGGYIIFESVNQLCIFNGAIWIPLILLFFLKSFNVERVLVRIWFSNIAGVFLGLTILAGHFQPAIHITLLLGIFILYRTFVLYRDEGWLRPLSTGIVNLAVCLSVAFCFAGVQILPSFEYAAHALRWIGAPDPIGPGQKVPYEIAGTSFNLHPQNILSFIIHGTHWAGTYFGILPLVLSIMAVIFKRCFLVKFFLLISVLSILYAIGDSSIIHGIGYAFVPFLEKVREADRAVYLSHFGLVVLAGFGVEFLINSFRKSEKRRFLIFTRVTSFFCVVVFIICIAFTCWISVFKPGSMSNPHLNNLYFFLLLLSFVVAILYIRYFGYLKLRALKVLIVCIIIFDLYAAFNGTVILRNKYDGQNNLYPGEYYKETEVIKFLRSQEGYFRIDNVKDTLPANFGNLFELSSTMGHGASMFKDYFEFKTLGWFPPSIGSNLLNVRYAVSKEPLTGLKLVMDGDVKLYENESCLPRAWLTTNYEVIKDVGKSYNRLREKTFDYRNTIIVDKEPSLILNTPEGGTLDYSVNIESYFPTKIMLKVNTNRNAFLVLSEIFYPGWRAKVDGEATSIYKINGILRGMIVQEGNHVVEFVYIPSTFKVGSILTILSLVSLCVLSLFGRQY